MSKQTFHEIVTDYVDDQNLQHIDGYLTDDENENGSTIALFDLDTGKTIFIKNEYRRSDQVCREIEKLKCHHTKTTSDQTRPVIEGIESYLIGVHDEAVVERVRMLCERCGSETVYSPCTSSWDIDTQQWEINDPCDNKVICNDCELEAYPNELSLDQTHLELNDEQWKTGFKPITNHLDGSVG